LRADAATRKLLLAGLYGHDPNRLGALEIKTGDLLVNDVRDLAFTLGFTVFETNIGGNSLVTFGPVKPGTIELDLNADTSRQIRQIRPFTVTASTIFHEFTTDSPNQEYLLTDFYLRATHP
jgi:hypothetical protein